jgi:hypothetical protein
MIEEKRPLFVISFFLSWPKTNSNVFTKNRPRVGGSHQRVVGKKKLQTQL